MDFYDWYKAALTTPREPEIRLAVNVETNERVVPIIEGIIGDKGYEESAVNVLNDGFIEDLPSWIAVEVPAIVDRTGIKGRRIPPVPKGFLALLRSYTGVYDLTAEAVIHKSKDYAIQAILANPVVHLAHNVKDMVERMINVQKKWLGYLK
jgi:alpha-galactosidase